MIGSPLHTGTLEVANASSMYTTMVRYPSRGALVAPAVGAWLGTIVGAPGIIAAVGTNDIMQNTWVRCIRRKF